MGISVQNMGDHDGIWDMHWKVNTSKQTIYVYIIYTYTHYIVHDGGKNGTENNKKKYQTVVF